MKGHYERHSFLWFTYFVLSISNNLKKTKINNKKKTTGHSIFIVFLSYTFEYFILLESLQSMCVYIHCEEKRFEHLQN